jgi:cyclophilin family peptidyl-prolyl cis-trans isomerase
LTPQFFVLYKSAHHLDYKHTVFGRVVGGFEVLSLMEKVPTDDDDRPLQVGGRGRRPEAVFAQRSMHSMRLHCMCLVLLGQGGPP